MQPDQFELNPPPRRSFRKAKNSVLESVITCRIIDWINRQPGCLVHKRHQTQFGTAGQPDISGCWHGRHVEIEVKRPGHVPTKLQEKRMAEWNAAGAVAFFATSLGEVQDRLAALTALPPFIHVREEKKF